MEKTKGEVQNIKDNNFTIENVWYNNKFKKLPEGFKKGVTAEVNYLIKNNKNYWQNLTFEEQVKPAYVEDDVMAEQYIPEKIPNQTVNTIIMSVKDILIKEFELGFKFTPEELIFKSELLTKMFVQDYKIIIANI